MTDSHDGLHQIQPAPVEDIYKYVFIFNVEPNSRDRYYGTTEGVKRKYQNIAQWR